MEKSFCFELSKKLKGEKENRKLHTIIQPKIEEDVEHEKLNTNAVTVSITLHVLYICKCLYKSARSER